MKQLDYDRWWPLHLSVARGEPLSEANRQIYLAGLRELHESDYSQVNYQALEAARRAIADLERQQASLRARRAELESEIAAAEAALDRRARQLLGVKE